MDGGEWTVEGVQGVSRRALVTGAGVRLGQAIAVGLAEAGYEVAVHHHTSPPDETLRLCQGRARAFQADLSRPEEVERLCGEALEWLGGLGLFVHAAALFFPTPTLDEAWDAWETFQNLNLKAAFLAVKHCREALKGGSAVFLADIYAERPLKGRLPYCVSKAGLIALAQGLAVDLAPDIRVNVVSPGAILPPSDAAEGYADKLASQLPLQRLGDPTDISKAVLFLANSPFITGQTLRIDGGRLLT